jgi:CheY-like chemotaxis protein
MRPRVVFIDDDQNELDDMKSIVQEEYDYSPIKWPVRSIEKAVGKPPSIFVLDLYFPAEGTEKDHIPAEHLQNQTARAKHIGDNFSRLYDAHPSGKELLRRTFSCIQEAYALLWQQCQDLKQSPANGRALLQQLKSHSRYKRVPVVFYSRKVTVSEAVRALQAGAVAVIPKVSAPPTLQEKEVILAQLKNAQAVYKSWFRVLLARSLGCNLNVTLFLQDVVGHKTELNVVKIGP